MNKRVLTPMDPVGEAAAGAPSVSSRMTRRRFLRRAAAVSGAIAAPWIIPSSALGAGGTVAPSERITVGVIGNGMMGRGHVAWCLGTRAVQLLAVCDVDRVRREESKNRAEQTYAAERAAGTYRGCAAYNDYRDLLVRPDIDAVLIATCDHWHALQAIDAARAGKDVYCEKPITLTIEQGRTLVKTMRRYGCVFQTGTQYRSMPAIRHVVGFVRAGGLGKVKSAFTLWGMFPENPPLPAEPVPDGLDWNLWVGPAPWHDYNRRYHENPMPGVVPWAFCEDFGAGAVTHSHSHSADVVQYGLGMENSGPVEIIHPSTKEFPTMTCRYANGVLHHLVGGWNVVKSVYKAVPPTARLHGGFGGVFVGERGWLCAAYPGRIEGGPETVFAEMKLGAREISGANDHHGIWLDCIRARRHPSADEEIGHRAASLGHLVILAHKLERSLKWDPDKEEFIGDDEANRLRSRAMREPWRM